jgi:hypothetical protein
VKSCVVFPTSMDPAAESLQSLTLADLVTALDALSVGAQRGAWRGANMALVGDLHKRLALLRTGVAAATPVVEDTSDQKATSPPSGDDRAVPEAIVDLKDLALTASALDIGSHLGAWRVEELSRIGELWNKLQRVVRQNAATDKEPMATSDPHRID